MADRPNVCEGDFAQRVDSESFGKRTQHVYDFLTRRVIAQERASERLARAMAMWYAGLKNPTRPITTVIFAGPTGVGKTMMAEELARCLIEDMPKPPFTCVECQLYIEHHQLSQLIGSPPGYVGYGEPPLLSQLKVDEPDVMAKFRRYAEQNFKGQKARSADGIIAQFYRRHRPFNSVVLFDEIEKAHPQIHKAMLGIIETGKMNMMNGDQTDFSNSVILLTCNIGGNAIRDIMSGANRPMGFGGSAASQGKPSYDTLDEIIYRETLKQIEKFFPAEFVGRLSSQIVIFRPLQDDACRIILDNMLMNEQAKVSGKDAKTPKLALNFSQEFKDFVMAKADTSKYGARKIRDRVEEFVTLQLANALESGGLTSGDDVLFKVEDKKPAIYRKARPEKPSPPKLLPPAPPAPSSDKPAQPAWPESLDDGPDGSKPVQ